ncbi:E3 ubiquitin protein ligase family protein [Endozoicomonas gorgoniicola]|uniref:RBR-type E3 ubiquitin transferase n=1 Tax=Endozoicomonas gorgoniicola TaxID=1234144 RepID=A0ABT3N1W0_9GAMM|nr:E3 ubiquitin protein ligase family protein [Endozoicomonas gorgoniicola]MCW7555179.1 E3 ubiquitin protein ligase family protein [Endozoicomonas gorgoniicola]
MDSEHNITRCLLSKASGLNQSLPSFFSLTNLGSYLYTRLSMAGSDHNNIPFVGVSKLKQPSLPLPKIPVPGFTSPALFSSDNFSSDNFSSDNFSSDNTEPLNQKEWVRSYLIPDNHSIDLTDKLNSAFHHIYQHQASGAEKPEKDTYLDIYASLINHKVRQVIVLPEHLLMQEQTFGFLNNLLEASLDAWLTHYLSISDTSSLIRLITVFIETAKAVMVSGAGGGDWNKGGWINNEFSDDAPFSVRISFSPQTPAQWMQALITLEMEQKHRLIALLYNQLHASVLSGNRNLARILRDRIMLIEVEAGDRLGRINDSGHSAAELSMHAEQLIRVFLSHAEDVQRYQTLATQNTSHTYSGRRHSAIELIFNEIESRLEQLTGSGASQREISELYSALQSLALLSGHFIHDYDSENSQLVDGDRQPTENSDKGTPSTTTGNVFSTTRTGGDSNRRPTRSLRQSGRENGDDDGDGNRPPHPGPGSPRYLYNSPADVETTMVTELENNPVGLTLNAVKTLLEAFGNQLLGVQSSNYPNNTLLHIIYLNQKTDIIEWIDTHIPSQDLNLVLSTSNLKNETPDTLKTNRKHSAREGLPPPPEHLIRNRERANTNNQPTGRPLRSPARYPSGSLTNKATFIVTDLDNTPRVLTLDIVKSLINHFGNQVLGVKSSNSSKNTLLHIIYLSQKTDIINWIHTNIPRQNLNSMLSARNSKNETPATQKINLRHSVWEGLPPPEAGASSTSAGNGLTTPGTSSGSSYSLQTRPHHHSYNNLPYVEMQAVTELENNPADLTLNALKSLIEEHGEEVLGMRSSNDARNTLLHIIYLNKKISIINWINTNVSNDLRKVLFRTMNNQNIAPAMLANRLNKNRKAAKLVHENISSEQIKALSEALKRVESPLQKEQEFNRRQDLNPGNARHKKAAHKNKSAPSDRAKVTNVRSLYDPDTGKSQTMPCAAHKESGCHNGFAKVPCCSGSVEPARICLEYLYFVVENYLKSQSTPCPNCQTPLDVPALLELTLKDISDKNETYTKLLLSRSDRSSKEKKKFKKSLEDCRQLDEILLGLIQNVQNYNSIEHDFEPYIDRENPDECLICMGEDSCVTIPDCGHKFCEPCMKDYLTELKGDLSQTSKGIVCPGHPCQASIPNPILEHIWGISTYQKMRHHQLKLAYQGSERILYCPFEYCETFFDPEEITSFEVKCPDCLGRFCVKCGARPYHDHLTCEQNEQAESTPQGADASMRIFLEKNKGVYKRCPNCNQPIEKNLGCKAMKCRSCRTQFCWDCLMISQNIHSHICSPSDNQATGSTTGENDPSNAICDFCNGAQPSEIAPMLCEHRACERCYVRMLWDGGNNQNESICTICNAGNNEDALLGEATGVTRVQTRESTVTDRNGKICVVCNAKIENTEFDVCLSCLSSFSLGP